MQNNDTSRKLHGGRNHVIILSNPNGIGVAIVGRQNHIPVVVVTQIAPALSIVLSAAILQNEKKHKNKKESRK
jgi:hypothetical protein